MNDLISRQAAIERATKDHDFYKGATTPADKARRDELLNVMCWLGELPSAQPEPDQNGDLWITVPDIDKVTRIYVQESKSKFCRIFYEEQPEPKSGQWILDRSGSYCCSKCMEPCAGYVMMKPRDKFCKMCGSRNEVTDGNHN